MLKLKRTDPATLEVTYNKNVTLDFDASDTDFKNALKSFDIYSPYSVSVTSTVSGTVKTWTASIWHLRAADKYEDL